MDADAWLEAAQLVRSWAGLRWQEGARYPAGHPERLRAEGALSLGQALVKAMTGAARLARPTRPLSFLAAPVPEERTPARAVRLPDAAYPRTILEQVETLELDDITEVSRR